MWVLHGSRLLLLSCVIWVSLGIGNAVAQTDCPPIPGSLFWILNDPPLKSMTPRVPDQIKDQARMHVDGRSGPGEGAGYCLYTANPASDGLILFLHGYQAGFEMGAYDPMVQFLTKGGHNVVYAYGPALLNTGTYPRRAIDALNHALSLLKAQSKEIRKLAVVGHSLGGMAALRVAAEWKGTPAITALIAIDPGPPLDSDAMKLLKDTACDDGTFPCQCAMDSKGCESWNVGQGLSPIACSTRLLFIQAQKTADECSCVPGQSCNCQLLWDRLPQIAKYVGSSGQIPQRNLLRVPHDVSHARLGPDFVMPSTHLGTTVIPMLFFPKIEFCKAVSVDGKDDYGCYLTSMDYWGYWRPTLAAVTEAFTGRPVSDDYSPFCTTKETTGVCKSAREMGNWQSDGGPATPLLNAADIPGLVANFPDYCPK
jgi:acetyl esterase/lipase